MVRNPRRRFHGVAPVAWAALLVAGCSDRLVDPAGELPGAQTAVPSAADPGDADPPPLARLVSRGGTSAGVWMPGVPIVPGQVVLKLNPGEDLATFHATWGTHTIAEVEPGGYVHCGVPGTGNAFDWVTDLLGSGDCEDVEPNFVSESPESKQGTIAFFEGDHVFGDVVDQTALARIGAVAAQQTATGVGIRVAIIDTGIDASHPDLSAAVDVDGFDFVEGDFDATDVADGIDQDGDGVADEGAGHGTHVAGIVRAIAPGATLLAVRVLDSEGNGTSVNVARGILWAIKHDADVINLSLGLYADAKVIKKAVADAVDAGVIVVNASGNLGRDDRRHFPARMSEVLCAAASDTADNRAAFSNWGPHVSVSAPGEGILSTFLYQGWAVWSGTSMSVPMISGACALRLEIDPFAMPSDVREAIEDSAAPMPIAGTPWEEGMGEGRLDVAALVTW